MGTGGWIGVLAAVAVIGIIAGVVIGFIFTKKMFEKQLRENPPINENQIRVMYGQMGRKPSEAQIKSTMRAIKNAK